MCLSGGLPESQALSPMPGRGMGVRRRNQGGRTVKRTKRGERTTTRAGEANRSLRQGKAGTRFSQKEKGAICVCNEEE